MHLSRAESRTAKVYAMFVVLSSLLILIVSVARASLEIWAQENNENKVRVNSIQLTRYLSDGSTQPIDYRLPEVTMMPTNPFYGFKVLRDWLWISFSRSALDKAKISLLIADKKIAEARSLFSNNAPNAGLEAAAEAIKKLKYSSDQAEKVDGEHGESGQLKFQITSAGLVYREILNESKDVFGIETEKLNALITDIDKWNETRAEKEGQQ